MQLHRGKWRPDAYLEHESKFSEPAKAIKPISDSGAERKYMIA